MAENTSDQNALSQGRNFVWHELYTPSLEGSLDFYQKALGFGTQSMDMGEMQYTMFTRNGAPICGVMDFKTIGMEVPPHWAVYLSVDNVDSSLEAVTANGGSIVVPAMDVPTIGRMALIADPQGAHIWLFTPAAM